MLNLKQEAPLLIRISEVGRCDFSPFLSERGKRRACNQGLKVGRHTFNPDLIWATHSAGSLYKDVEEGSFGSLLTSPLLLWYWSLFLRIPGSTEEQLRHQPHGLNNYWTLGLSFHTQPLLGHMDFSL